MGSVRRLMRIVYLAPQLSHRMLPTECSMSIMHEHDCVLPQNGQSKICATLGLAFLGGGLARLRLPLRRRRSAARLNELCKATQGGRDVRNAAARRDATPHLAGWRPRGPGARATSAGDRASPRRAARPCHACASAPCLMFERRACFLPRHCHAGL